MRPSDRGYVESVLCFVRESGRLLLIRKRRGLGAGKINGPGGKLEPGESRPAAAVRETEEEIGVTPTGLREAGELWFDFADGFRLHCAVFTAEGRIGEPHETEEAFPFWCAEDALPYPEMWADDAHWLPLMLEGKRFEGRFRFDGDTMLFKDVRILENP